MSNIFVTCQAPGSYFAFAQQLKTHLQQGKLTALAIVPVNRAVRRLKRLLTQWAENQTLIDPPVFTFDRLLLHLYQSFPFNKRLIPSDTLLVLVQEILESESESFQYLTSGKEIKGGLVQRVWETALELREFGFSSSELAGKEGQIKDIPAEKYEDFVKLLAGIEEKLGEEFIDEPFARALAARSVTQEQFQKLFPDVKAVYISGYGLFSPPMLDFIKRVGQWLPVRVQLDYLQANQNLFMHTQQALEKFKMLGAQIEHKSTTSFVARFLFNRQSVPPKKDFRRRIQLIALTNRQQEVAYIAGRIRQLNAQGVPLHKIAVTFSHLEKYARTIRTVFEDFGIPFNLSTGFELLQSPLIATFLNLLKIIEEDFPVESTLGFLQSQFVQSGEVIDFSRLKSLIFQARLPFLNKSGLAALRRFISVLKQSAEEAEWDEAQLQRQIDLLESRLQPLFEFPARAPAGWFRKKYLELCEHLGLLSWYKSENEHLSERQKEHNFRAYNRFVKVFERSLWTLNLLYREQPISRGQLLESLQRALLSATYNLTEWPDYGVQIMPRLEILALDFDVLFVGGLIDGDFPRAAVKDIFFNDRLRSELGLVASEELLDQDRFLFYQLLESGAAQVVLTFPRFQEEEALVASSFLSDLSDIALIDTNIPQEDDPVFENRQKLWTDFGRNIQFIALENFKERALQQLHLLQALPGAGAPALQRLLDQIRFSLSRTMGKEFSPFEGNLSFFEEITSQLQQRFARHVWSVSRLETYAQCPMKFFLSYILKIEAPQKIEDELTPGERGLVLHRIMFRFFSALKAMGRQHEAWRFTDLLRKIALEEFEQMPYRGLFWEMEKTRFLGSEKLKGVLQAFLELEEQRMTHMQFVPQYFELSFGYSGDFPADPNSIEHPVTLRHKSGTLRLQGRIDRIDLNSEGLAAIIDYKTGEVNGNLIREVIEGRLLQVPLYLKVLPEIFPESVPVFGGLYGLKNSEKVKLTPVIADGNCACLPKSQAQAYLPNSKVVDENDGHELTFEEALDRALEFALRDVQNIQKGAFSYTLNPDDPACKTYCEFRRMCQKVVGKLERIGGGK